MKEIEDCEINARIYVDANVQKQIADEHLQLITTNWISEMDVLAVYAEDQKEDQEIRGSLAKTCTDLNNRIVELEMAERERKQKLQSFNDLLVQQWQYWSSFDKRDEFQVTAFRSSLGKIMDKFEELLKV